jgi:hypothetical protein
MEGTMVFKDLTKRACYREGNVILRKEEQCRAIIAVDQ